MRGWRTGLVALVGLGFITMLATPVAASDELPGAKRSQALWYADQWFDFAKLRAEGATGKGIKIAVIDEAINPDVSELRGANITVKGTTCVDPKTQKPTQVVSSGPKLAEHGTNVVSMLVGNGTAVDGGAGARGIAPDAEIWFYGTGSIANAKSCKVQDPTVKPGGIDLARDITLSEANSEHPVVKENTGGHSGFDPTSMAARAAIRDGADVISLSVLGGTAPEWSLAMAEAQIAGVPVVVGTPNPDAEFKLVGGPWDANGAVPVSAVDWDGKTLADPKTGEVGLGSSMLAVAAPGVGLLGSGDGTKWGPAEISGTSYATPLVAGAVALGMQKHPDASAFQVLQSLVRTTGKGAAHEPDWIDSHMGYGYLSPSGMLAADASQFPNENPMFVKNLKDPRCQGNGFSGATNAKGEWECAWSAGPFPAAITLLEDVKSGKVGVVDSAGQPGWSPYSKEPKPGAPQNSFLPWVLGGVAALLLIGAAVAIIAASNSKRKRAARSQGAASGGLPSSDASEPMAVHTDPNFPGGVR